VSSEYLIRLNEIRSSTGYNAATYQGSSRRCRTDNMPTHSENHRQNDEPIQRVYVKVCRVAICQRDVLWWRPAVSFCPPSSTVCNSVLECSR
jgi:hypothetical protein